MYCMKSAAFHTKCQLLPRTFFLTTAKRIHQYPFCEAFHRSMVTLTSSLLFGRLWCITGRLPTRRSMLLPRVRGGGTWLLLLWNIVMVGSYQRFPTLKMFRFCFRTLEQENHTDFPVSWYSCWLLMREASLDSVCISLYEPQMLTFRSAGSVPSQSGPSEAVLVVWAQGRSGLQVSCSHHFHWVWLRVPAIGVTLKRARWLVWPQWEE